MMTITDARQQFRMIENELRFIEQTATDETYQEIFGEFLDRHNLREQLGHLTLH